MYILGINNGHNASITLTKNNKIIFSISEERLNRKKNFWGFPKESINYVYQNIVSKNEIAYYGFYRESVADFASFLWGGGSKSTKINLVNRLFRNYGIIFYNYLKYFISKKFVLNYYSKQLGVSVKKIFLINHHLTHVESLLPLLNNKKSWLIFSNDAEGDGESATIYKYNEGALSKLQTVSRSNSIGYFYTYITQFLGFKPNAHEFKVMGLEPYAKKTSSQYKKIYKSLRKLFVNYKDTYYSSLNMASQKTIMDYFKKNLFLKRFDSIAGSAQDVLEDVILNWIKVNVKKHQIYNVGLTGGTMMNVKLVQKISELVDVEDLEIMPSSGDESTTIGVCNYIYKSKTGLNLVPFNNYYLGREFKDNYIEDEISKFIKDKKNTYEYSFYETNINKIISELLAAGEIVARFKGREEFGARALGNRSILANPSNEKTISNINKMIKDRDFWMPFTPTILFEKANLYIQNPKKLSNYFMSQTYNSTTLGNNLFSAAIHPYDKTMRIQMLKKEHNPDYYDLILNFSKITNIYGLLNTSFNLHGEPNVSSPFDALRTMHYSGLNYLSIGNFLVKKIK